MTKAIIIKINTIRQRRIKLIIKKKKKINHNSQ